MCTRYTVHLGSSLSFAAYIRDDFALKALANINLFSADGCQSACLGLRKYLKGAQVQPVFYDRLLYSLQAMFLIIGHDVGLFNALFADSIGKTSRPKLRVNFEHMLHNEREKLCFVGQSSTLQAKFLTLDVVQENRMLLDSVSDGKQD